MRKLLSSFLLFILASASAFAGGSTAPVIPGYYAPGVQTTTVQAQEITTTATYLATGPTSVAPTVSTPPAFAPLTGPPGPNDIRVDPSETFQPILGAGCAATDAACYNWWVKQSAAQRLVTLTNIFGASGANCQICRICFGQPDFRSTPSSYTYDDMPAGQTDTGLLNFSTVKDTAYIIPVLQLIRQINPNVKFVASIWSPPTWMLTSGSVGSPPEVFNDSNYTYLSQYIIKAIQDYQGKYGIPIYAVSVQNEPTVPTWMTFSSTEEKTLIGTYLGPNLVTNGLNTKIFCFDDNWPIDTQGSGWTPGATATYAAAVLNDSTSGYFTQGVCYHGYSFGSSIMSMMHEQYPSKLQICSEWRSYANSGSNPETLATDMSGMAGGWFIGSFRNWANAVIVWNGALDENGQANGNSPTSPSPRRGMVTINSSTGVTTYNPEYFAAYNIFHWWQPGAARCASTSYGQPYRVYSQYPNAVVSLAYKNPDGSVVLTLYNGTGQTYSGSPAQVTGGSSITCNVIDARSGQGFPVTMGAGETDTFTWGTSAQLSPSSAATVTAVPAAPVLTATAGAGENDLSWTVPTSAGPIAWYNVLRGPTTGTETQLAQVPTGTTTYVDLLGASGQKFYQVQAVSSPGGPGALSTEQSAAATSAAVPAVPSSPSAGVVGTNIALNWTAPSPVNGSTVTLYNVLRGTSTGAETQYATSNQGYTTYSDAGAVTGTQYFYKVAAVNTTGTSSNSSEVNATVTVSTPTQDAVSQATQAAAVATTLTWAHTVGTLTNGILVVAVGFDANSSASVSTVKYGGVSCTLLQTINVNSGNTSDRSTSLWYLKNPTAGTANIVVTMSSSGSPTADCAVSFSHVNQTTPFRTVATGISTSSAAQAATTTGGSAGDLIISAIHLRGASPTMTSTGTGQTTIISNTAAGNNYPTYVSTQTGGSGSIVNSYSWTTSADYNSMLAVAMQPG